ncbi:EsaB/YukD family protein [Bacillus cytotoxicus]|uniref:Protein EsaB n=2 Tax=Bacillus cytotoxicus TaxID=580165 RepID=A0AAX2CGC4_9BACI|nr:MULTISPECIES: EsaB/YukD family protein [Bacillus cereus group]ABS21886.1 conserved hypothetical protein [Bacillus cytotoxicus NVH 391-98]AWC28499.1 hypothetical protein CG483_008995 [Bacillus cytotoxicus]AWC32523.1 hypothetical protein CG482_008825 [Bacillus cytotoxicus]AWC36551.1 hypothetical protein CG481_008835 [Bacillus cytotoxicus]AWC40117.1 hypothetical protein CG480_006260 [Bacillus cytotoxicus]
MAVQTHINVTVDFRKWNESTYDLRIPIHQTVKYLLKNLVETLRIEAYDTSNYVIKVVNKSMLLTDDDRLVDHKVTDGDILKVL